MANRKEKTQKKKPKEEKEETPEEQKPLEETPTSPETPQAPFTVEPQTPKTRFEALTYPFKVIISPVKAFKRISAYPDVKGFLVIIVLLILVSAAVQFSVATKIVLDINAQRTSLIVTSYFQDFLAGGIVQSVFIFFVSWLLFGGALLLITTLVGPKGGGGWRTLFIIIGYAFMVIIIRTGVSAILLSTLPQIDFGFSSWPPVTETDITNANNQINSIWGPLLAFQAGTYISIIFDAWLVILAVMAIHAYRGVPWTRAATIAVTAYLIYYTLRIFIGF